MGEQTPVPMRQNPVQITLQNGRQIPLAPLQYKEEAQQEALDLKRAENMMSPTVIAAQIRGSNPANLQHVSQSLPNGGSRMGTFNPETGAYSWSSSVGGSGGMTGEGSGIVEGDASTIPAQYRNQVVAIAEGRQKPPSLGNRPNSPGALIMGMVNDYDRNADFAMVNARWAARQERTKGSSQSRGGQLSRLNQLSGHTESMADAAKELDKLSDSAYRAWNAVKMGVRPGGRSAPVARFNTAANTAVEEYIATITTGRPTNEEIQSFKSERGGFDETASPQERKAAIVELRRLAEERANAMEAWWTQTFGKSSVEMNDPILDPRGWTYSEDEGWRMKWSIKGEKKGATAAPSTPTAPTPPPGLSPEGLAYWKQLHGVL